jgi:aldehyde dehydrogenase (NAD+)
LTERLIAAYRQVRIGNPLVESTLMGPLISTNAVKAMQAALRQLRREGGQVLYGGEALRGATFPGGRYVRPCIAMARPNFKIIREETFAPILYLMSYSRLDEAIEAHNAVPQGLSSAIFTNDLR